MPIFLQPLEKQEFLNKQPCKILSLFTDYKRTHDLRVNTNWEAGNPQTTQNWKVH